ncbi:MAG TPA: dihydroneopterin aldolase, partial [Naasia sp.]
MSRDRIRLTGLRVHGRHGVFPAERELGQVFVVDLELVLDLS